MNTIVIALDPAIFPAGSLAQIEEIAPDRRTVVTRERDEIESLLDEIEIAVGWFPHDLLAGATALRWFQQWSAGADWLLNVPELAERSFVLTSTSGIHAIQITEHIFAMLLALARRLPDALAAQRQGVWTRVPGESLVELANKTMLVVGVGAIGTRTAQVADALGMRVWGVRNDPSQNVPHVTKMVAPDRMSDLLSEADVVVLTVPLTEETRHMIGEPELRRMKPNAYLVNVGRGGTLDDLALHRALSEGWIAGAGLDVFEEEPLPEGSPLWTTPNLLITAHYSGATPHYHERAMDVFLDNLRRYVAGEPLQNVVDKARGY